MRDLILIPWFIDKNIIKGYEKKEIIKAKYFDISNKIIIYDFLGYSHSLSILEELKRKNIKFSRIIFFGAASYWGKFSKSSIVYPESNFVFLKYEDRISEDVKLRVEESEFLSKNITSVCSSSMTVDYAGYFTLGGIKKIKDFQELFIEMEWGFIQRWSLRNNIKSYPIYILTDKWGDEININKKIKKSFKRAFYKILEVF